MSDMAQPVRSPEVVNGPLAADQSKPGVAVLTDPTQVRRPWRSTLRTAFQVIVGLAALLPILVQQVGLDPEQIPWLAVPLAVAAVVTRVMSSPAVETFLRRFVPWLAAAPDPVRTGRR
jgi:hypothetical protein